MTGRTVVVGLGQTFAGDDGAGLAVLAELRRRPLPSAVRLETVGEASELVALLQTTDRVVIVDAALGSPGTVALCDAARLCAEPMAGVSSHGLGVRQAIELARTLFPDSVAPRIDVVAVGIERPGAYGVGLSEAVRRGVVRAAETVRALLGERPDRDERRLLRRH